MRPLTEAQQSLASDPKHIRMAERFAEFACEKRGLPFLIPDAKAVALLGLVKAARDFDPGRGWLFKELYPGWRHVEASVTKAMANQGQRDRTGATKVLIINERHKTLF